MMISPIGTGSGVYSANSAGMSPEQKLADLKMQRSDCENQLKLNNSPELQNKLDTLDKQIKNLSSRTNKAASKEECETCKNRKYKDGSDDPGVSFKSAAKINPKNARAVVSGHENEHVVRNRAKAEREGNEIVSQTVTLKTDICPECGKSYVSGGETRTVTKVKNDNAEKFNVGIPDKSKESGRYLNKVA